MRCVNCRQDEQDHAIDSEGSAWCRLQSFKTVRAIPGRLYTDGMRQGIGLENGKVGVYSGGVVLAADMGSAWAEVGK